MKLEFKNGSKRAKLLRSENFNGVFMPKGWTFDGASYYNWFGLVAMALVGLHPWHPKIRKAAMSHDRYYDKGLKELGDKKFKLQMRRDGANLIQIYACYWAVKYFGKANKGERNAETA